MEYVLKMEDVCKSFPGVKALDHVNLRVRPGEVHALMGENGAGKSTLMNVLSGIHRPDSGNIFLRGERVVLTDPHDAIKKGIAMIHQELNPVPDMTVTENIFLGKEIRKRGFADDAAMKAETQKLFDRLGFTLNPSERMGNLTMSGMQLVEIAKAVSYNADIIVMDEPSSSITENEVKKLFHIILGLKAKGVSVIYITHKMDEVFQIADQVTVLRDGKYIDSRAISEFTSETLISMLVGRNIDQIYPKERIPIGEVTLRVEHLTKKGAYEDVTFEVRKGEIFGVAGLVGAGRTEVFESVAGITKADSGDIFLGDRKLKINSPHDAIVNRIVIATEDRKGTGLCLPLSIRDNIMMESFSAIYRNGFVSEKHSREISDREMVRLNIKAPGSDQAVKNLSGGNQQKVVLSKVLLTNPQLVIFDEPTRGIDVGAKTEIYKIMTDLVKEGKSVIMISSELPEILGMSDRIMVMHEGKVAGILERNEMLTQEKIFNLACGEN